MSALIALAVASTTRPLIIAGSVSPRITTRISDNTVIVVDADNVRGKCNFLPQISLIAKTVKFAKRQRLLGNMHLVFDHGQEYWPYHLKRSQMNVVFAGPKRTADDVIVNHIPFFFQHSAPALVVTADAELKERCRRVAGACGGTVSFLHPDKFVAHLNLSLTHTGQDPALEDVASLGAFEQQLVALEEEMEARAALLRIRRVAKKKKMGNIKKKRRIFKLEMDFEAKISSAMSECARLGTAEIAHHLQDDSISSTNVLRSLLHRHEARKSQITLEHTWNRKVSAELLRRRFKHRCGQSYAPYTQGLVGLCSIWAMTSFQGDEMSPPNLVQISVNNKQLGNSRDNDCGEQATEGQKRLIVSGWGKRRARRKRSTVITCVE